MIPYYQDPDVTLFHGDCLEVLRSLPEHSLDAIVTDPPYGLSFMGKKWDYDVPSVGIWMEALRVLRPGGHLLSFAGTRTQHRMACHIEAAGFEIRDLIFWAYGSGFPKSLDVSKAIDSKLGAEREVIGEGCKPKPTFHTGDIGGMATGDSDVIPIPCSHAAKEWEGWGTALKPALEPITMARKPLIGTVAENVLKHGTGGINVDGCRVPGVDSVSNHGRSSTVNGWGPCMSGEQEPIQTEGQKLGRWPANLIHDGSEDVTGLFPVTTSGSGNKNTGNRNSINAFGDGLGKGNGIGIGGDSGSAARFFYCAKSSKADRNEGLEAQDWTPAGEMTGGREEGSAGLNSPRAGAGRTSGGKNIHPTVKPTALMRYLCRLVTPPGGLILDPFMGSGSTGKAALLEGFRFIGMEREEAYLDIARDRILAARRAQQEIPLS